MAKAHDAIMERSCPPRAKAASSRAPWPSSLKAFHFPKRQFGSKDEERSFRAEWCDGQVLLLYILISSLSTKATFSITA